MKQVPPAPDQVRLRTGERVRIDVTSDKEGYLTVFNVGPSGTLNLLYPEGDLHRASPPGLIKPNQPLHILDVEMTPPIGHERLFAVWSRQPLHLEQLAKLVDEESVSGPYRATRDMKRVQQSVRQLDQSDWKGAILELEHVP
jgi:hypothetical protein